MAAPKGIFTLNLGTQTISLAEFQRNADGGLILARIKHSEILGDPGVDASRTAQTKLQVQQLAAGMGLKAQKVNYAIASHVIFTRPVTLPSVGEASQVEQIVQFEAQQNVPYPIDEVVWDWQLLDAGDGSQIEVILAAVKADLLDEINDAVQAGGILPITVDIAPMALYNALRYNYSDAEGCTKFVFTPKLAERASAERKPNAASALNRLNASALSSTLRLWPKPNDFWIRRLTRCTLSATSMSTPRRPARGNAFAAVPV